jgi:hypothetical protein
MLPSDEVAAWSTHDEGAAASRPSPPFTFLPAEPGLAQGNPYSGNAEPQPGVDGTAAAHRHHGWVGAEVSDSRPR